jgi:starch phosphorylase
MVLSNPGLTVLLTKHIGDGWIADLEDELARIEPFATDSGFQTEWRVVKAANKRALAQLVRQRTGITVDPQSLFDIQVKRLHEYKRQHLNALFLVTEYQRIRAGGEPGPPRTVLFGGKAAPGYRMAKLMIKLINAVATVINADPVVSKHLKVVFLPDFNVKSSHHVYPAADLSEQISTAGKEASGTGNMKFAMNGALTIGTLDGANVEIREAVGEENFFLFGLTAGEVQQRKAGGYNPRLLYQADPQLRHTLDLIGSGFFSNGDPELFRPMLDSLLNHDDYMLLADFRAYVDCQGRVSEAYRDEQSWTRMSILNCARVGRFSSDRSIRDYCRDIWGVKPTRRTEEGS